MIRAGRNRKYPCEHTCSGWCSTLRCPTRTKLAVVIHPPATHPTVRHKHHTDMAIPTRYLADVSNHICHKHIRALSCCTITQLACTVVTPAAHSVGSGHNHTHKIVTNGQLMHTRNCVVARRRTYVGCVASSQSELTVVVPTPAAHTTTCCQQYTRERRPQGDLRHTAKPRNIACWRRTLRDGVAVTQFPVVICTPAANAIRGGHNNARVIHTCSNFLHVRDDIGGWWRVQIDRVPGS